MKQLVWAWALCSCGMVWGAEDPVAVKYIGNYQAAVTSPAQYNNAGRMTRSPKTREFHGEVTVNVKYKPDGTLQGTWKATGGLFPNTFVGTKNGDICVIDDGTREPGRTREITCTPEKWAMSVRSAPSAPEEYEVSMMTLADDSDAKRAQREAEARKVQAEANAKANAERAADEARQQKLLQSLPPIERPKK